MQSSKVYEDNKFLAFMNIQLVNKWHVLIIPKKHYELVSDMDKKSLGEIRIIVERINSAIRKSKIKCQGINFFLADEEAAGQEVFHVHLHVIPRFKNDDFGFKFPKNYKNKPEIKEIEEAARKIKVFIWLLTDFLKLNNIYFTNMDIEEFWILTNYST